MSNKTKKERWITTFQIFAAYLVAAWTFLQFVDWILNRYNLSPNWVDVLLWTFIGIIPSLLIYLYHRERIHKGQIKLREKILMPLNVIILGVILLFGFGNTDLGAMTKEVSFENSQGEIETKIFVKEEFRTGIPIYGFEQKKESDSSYSWMTYGLSKILYYDLLQNKNISPEYNYRTTTSAKIRDASLFHDKYVDGEFETVDDEFQINVKIRKASNAKIIKEKQFRNSSIFNILDNISVFIASEVDKSQKLTYIDLPIDEYMTNSIEALEYFAKANYEKAFITDKRFALAYLEESKEIMAQNSGTLELQDIIDKAFIYKSKLPLQKQLEVLIQKNLAYGNYEEAEKQIKLQLEVDPKNRFYNSVLFSIYGETRNVEAYFKKAEELFTKNPGSHYGIILSVASIAAGYEDELLDALSALQVVNPGIKYLKIEPLSHKNEISKAKSILYDYRLSYSGNTNRPKVYDSIFSYYDNKSSLKFKPEQFIGKFRSNNNEQTLEFWIEDDKLLEYVKNQSIKAYLPAGKDAIGGGFIEDYTYYAESLKDSLGEVYGLKKSLFYWNTTIQTLFWKLDEDITEGQNALENGYVDKAIRLFTKAKSNNPNHKYIDNILHYLEFTKGIDSTQIISQFEKHKGQYGPRKFWIDKGKFYYKRLEKDVNLAKVELLPINDSTYMDLTRLGTTMVFRDEKNKSLSISYSLNIDDLEWKISNPDINILEKNAP